MKNLIKSKISYSLFLMITALFFFACNDEKEDEQPTPEPTASFTFSPENPGVDEEIVFTVTSENASTFTWSFGDANSSSEENPTHSYSAAGSYEVTLIASGAGGSVNVTETINVVEKAENIAVFFVQNVDSTGSYTIQKISNIGLEPIVEAAFETTGYTIHATYDDVNEKIYYSDDDNLQVVSNNLEGTNEQVVVDGLEGPRGLALNDDGSILYVADRFAGQILSVELSSGTKSVLYDSLDFSAAISADPAFNTLPVGLAYHDGTIYITCVEIDGEATYKAAADGSSLEQLNGYTDAGYGYDIAVDVQNQKLIFDNGDDAGELLQSDYNGGNISTFVTTQSESKTYGIDIDADASKVYWSTEAGYIQRSNLDGSEVEDLSVLEGRVNRGLFVVKMNQ